MLQRWKAAQFPSTEAAMHASPIANHTERHVVRWALAAGFVDVRLRLHIDVKPSRMTSWSAFLGVAPHPWSPPTGELLADFSPDDRKRFEQLIRPLIEGGRWMSTATTAYLVATRPRDA